MPSVVVFILCFFQGQWPGALPSTVVQPQPAVQRVIDLAPLPNPEAERRNAACAQKRFEDSFNRLVRTLADFSDRYNQRHTIDVKNVKALKKAWHELEKSEPWFKGR